MFFPAPLFSALVGGGPVFSSDIFQLVNDRFELLCLDSDQEDTVSGLKVERLLPAAHQLLSADFLWLILEPIHMHGLPCGMPVLDSLLQQSGGYLPCSLFQKDLKHWLDRLIYSFLCSGYVVFSFTPGSWFVCHSQGLDLPLFVHKVFKLSPFTHSRSFSLELANEIERLAAASPPLPPKFCLRWGKIEEIMAQSGSCSLSEAISLASSQWKWSRDDRMFLLHHLENLVTGFSEQTDRSRSLHHWRHEVKLALQQEATSAVQQYFDQQPIGGAAPHRRDSEVEYKSNRSLSLSGCTAFLSQQLGKTLSVTYVSRLLLPPRKNSSSAHLYSGIIHFRPFLPAKNDDEEDLSIDRHYCAALIQLRRFAYGALPWPHLTPAFAPLKGALGLARDDKARIYTSGSAVRRPTPVYCRVDADGNPCLAYIGKTDFEQVRDQSVIAQGILIFDAKAGLPLPDNCGSARNSGTSVYLLRDGREGQGAAQHLAELFYAIEQSPASFSSNQIDLCSALLIICDGGSYEQPKHKSVLLTHVFLRYVFKFRSLSICTNAGGCSELSPAERPHSVVSRRLSGEPLGKVNPLGAVQERLAGATFSGKPLQSFVLDGWKSFIPDELVSLTDAHCLALTRSTIGQMPVVLPSRLQALLSKLSIPQPPSIIWKQLLEAQNQSHFIRTSSTCTDLTSCGCSICGGPPRDGVLTPQEQDMVAIYPVPDPYSHGHYLSFFSTVPLLGSGSCKRTSEPDSYLPSLLLKRVAGKLSKEGSLVSSASQEQVSSLSSDTLLSEKNVISQLQQYVNAYEKKSGGAILPGTSLEELSKRTRPVLNNYLVSVGLETKSKEKKAAVIQRVWEHLQSHK